MQRGSARLGSEAHGMRGLLQVSFVLWLCVFVCVAVAVCVFVAVCGCLRVGIYRACDEQIHSMLKLRLSHRGCVKLRCIFV